MNINETTKNALLTLLSSSDTSSDEDLSDLLTILEQELSQQRRKLAFSSQRKRRKIQQKLSSVPKNIELDIQTTNSDAATNAKQIPTVISVDKSLNKVSTSLNCIKDEILRVYLENWQHINYEEFRKLFHIHKTTFRELLQSFEKFQQEKLSDTISQTKRCKMLLIFLLYAGHQISLKTLSHKIKICRSTLSLYIDFLTDYLLSLAATKVRLPESASEKAANANEFYSIAGLKNVIGCIEKLHFRIAPPDRCSYKNTNSFSVELACDARGRFLDHDAETLDSTLAQVCEHNYCFLASLKFSLREWTIIPCQANDGKSQLNADQQLFNEKFRATFAVLQTGVRQLQQRFRQLLCIDGHRLTFARRFSKACFGLHNFLVNCDDFWLDEENLQDEDWQPLVVDAMIGTETQSVLDRFSCPRGLEKRERMIYETCIFGFTEEKEIVVDC